MSDDVVSSQNEQSIVSVVDVTSCTGLTGSATKWCVFASEVQQRIMLSLSSPSFPGGQLAVLHRCLREKRKANFQMGSDHALPMNVYFYSSSHDQCR